MKSSYIQNCNIFYLSTVIDDAIGQSKFKFYLIILVSYQFYMVNL